MAEDKLGQSIKVGDVVDFVYGGDPHCMTVEEIHEENMTPALLKGHINVYIPAPACERFDPPQTAPKEEAPKAPRKTHTRKGQE